MLQPDLRHTSRAALVQRPGGPFEVHPVELEAPRAGEVLVRLVGCGICHTDLVFRDSAGLGLAPPFLLGHEGSGIVEAVGDGVTDLAPGDPVVLSFLPCGDCPTCRKGQPAYCYHFAAHNYSGGRAADGSSPVTRRGERVSAAFFGQSSFATHAIANRRNTVKVDAEAPLELLGPLGCGVQTGAGAAINALGVGKGDSFIIFGGGSVGLSALLGALAMEARTVIVVEPNADRAAIALELGAARVVDPKITPDLLAELRELSGGGVNHVLDTTGIPALIGTGAQLLLQNGLVGVLGIPPMDATLPINIFDLMLRGAGVKAIIEGDADPHEFIPRMIQLYREGRFPFDRLITKFPFERINDAVAASLEGRVIKPVLIF